MLKQTSKRFRTLFLLKFTKGLIKQSGGEIFELENILKKESNKIKERAKQKIKAEEKPLIEEKIAFQQIQKAPLQIPKPLQKPIEITRPLPVRRIAPQILIIPEPRLPLRLQYLKPAPSEKHIDLGRLNPLLKDPMVRVIECPGADKNVIVNGTMGKKMTDIILDEEEVQQVIEKFSETSRIPVQEGVFRVAAGRLILLAIVSNLVSSKFIIRKMMHAPVPRPIR